MIQVSPAMSAAFSADVRRPDFQVLSYDISTATGETWGSIIDGSSTQTPVDLTPYVIKVQWGYDKISVVLADESLRFHPDSGDLSASLCPGHAIRVIEGDTTVAEVEWPVIFSGIIQGPYDWSLSRGSTPSVKFSSYSRESNEAWKARNVTGNEFTVGTDWAVMFRDLVVNAMSMADAEIAVSQNWDLMFDKNSNQIVNIPPWEALTKLVQGNMNRLWFNGKGQIAMYPFTLGHVTAQLLNRDIVSYTQPGNDSEVVNKVSVEYIDNVLTKVTGGRQSLGTANLTAGFYDFETKIDIFYSEDKKQQAENVQLIVNKSINENGLGISIGSEELVIDNEFGGQLVIHVDEWVSVLATAGIAAIIDSAFIPDGVALFETIPIGRVEQALGTVAVLLAMMILGNGVYEIVGNPIEHAFLEKTAVALIDNIKFWEEKANTIRMEFISTEAHAHSLALNELLFAQSTGLPRTLSIKNNPLIEPGDILELETGVKFFVQQATKTLTRGSNSEMKLAGFRSIT